MALKSCEECGTQISEKAPSCPKCGAPNQVITQRKESGEQVTKSSESHVTNTMNQHKGSEVVYYSDNRGVKVTNTRFIVNATTYPLNGITSINSVEIPVSKTPAMLVMLLGVVMLFAGMGNRSGGGLAVIGVLVIGLGVWYWTKIRNKYAVKISTSAAETNALISYDKEHINQVTRALNEAVIHRG